MYSCATRKDRSSAFDAKEAMRLMKLSANLGYAPALVDYGIYLLNGIDVQKNEEEPQLVIRVQCATCGLYGSDDIGIFEACVHYSHENHAILDFGVLDKCCTCKSLDCLFKKD